MRDPIGVCFRIEKLHVTHAQCGGYQHSGVEEDTQDKKTREHVRLSTAKTKNAESSRRKESRNPWDLSERRRSWSGYLDITARPELVYEHKSNVPNTHDTKVASLGVLDEPNSKQVLKPLRRQSLPSLLPGKQSHASASEQPEGLFFDKQYATRVQTKETQQNDEKEPVAEVTNDSPDGRSNVHDPEPKSNRVTVHDVCELVCDDNSKEEPSVKLGEKLPHSPAKTGKKLAASFEMILPIRGRSQTPSVDPPQVVSQLIRIGKRMTEGEDEEMEATVSRTTKRRFGITTTPTQPAIVVEALKSQGNSSLTPTPIRVWKSKHPDIDKSAFEFVLKVETPRYGSPSAPPLEVQSEASLTTQQIDLAPVQFVSGLETFNSIIPGCDAMQRFQTMQNTQWSPFKCLANTKAEYGTRDCKWSGRKCNWRLERANRDLIGRTLSLLHRMNIYVQTEECIEVLEMMANEGICHHHRELAKMLFKSRVRELLIGRIQEQEVVHKPITVVSNSKFEIGWWLRHAPHGAVHYLPAYQSFGDPGLLSEAGIRSITNQARRPLIAGRTFSADGLTEHDETRDGYLYVYWNRASFGHLKIGFTGKDVDQRLQEWEEQCHHIAEKQYQSPRKIKHAARVEKLIHTEFAHQRVCEPACHGCGKAHIEWFRNLDLGLVVRRIEAWCEWIDKSPYEYRGGVWRLKEDDPHFDLPLPSATQTETPPPQTTPKKPSRPSPRPKSSSSSSSSPRQSFRPSPQRTRRDESPTPQPSRSRPPPPPSSTLFDLVAAQTDRAVSASNSIFNLSVPILR